METPYAQRGIKRISGAFTARYACNASSFSFSRMVTMPRDSFTMPAHWNSRSVRVITSRWEPRWLAMASWVILSSRVPSMEASCSRKAATPPLRAEGQRD